MSADEIYFDIALKFRPIITLGKGVPFGFCALEIDVFKRVAFGKNSF